MKKYLLLALILILFVFGPSLVFSYIEKSNQKPVINSSNPINTETLWSLVQKWRTDNGFQTYMKDQNLCAIATKRVNQLKKIAPEKRDHELFESNYSNYPSAMVENITGGTSEQDALERWLNSPPHRATLEKPYKYSCIATKDDFAVQIFSNCENGCP